MAKETVKNKVRVAAVGDIHVRTADKGKWSAYFQKISENADILAICGDLTDTGDESEAEILAEELKWCHIPVVAVLGNHDHEKSRHKLIRQIMEQAKVHMLDGEAVVIKDVGFAGIKGFGGGFDRYMLSMFGEQAMKAFVQEAVNEALHLDRALAKLEQENSNIKKIALMHYAPIKDTIKGEPEVIFPFLGSSRLAEPLNKRQVVAAFHGHAHAGILEGATADGTRIYNVALPILYKQGFENGFFVLEV